MKSSLNGKNILVVGGAGFVGSNLVNKLVTDYSPKTIYVVDNLLSSGTSNLPQNSLVLKFIYGSIAEYSILNKIPDDINFVFHLACFHGNQSSIEDPIADHNNNNITSLMLFNYIKDFKFLEKVVYSAAGCAVAEKTSDEASPTKEDAPVSLFHDSPYSISKLVGEMYGNYFFTRHSLPFVKARFQNVYGPREILGAGQWRGTKHTIWRNVVPTFIWKALNNQKLPLENGGVSTRDFIYVDDIVNGLIACAENGHPGNAYNLASGIETSILSLSELINHFTNNTAGIESNPKRDWDRSVKRYGSTSFSEEKIGFKAKVGIEEGLKKTIGWTKENMPLIESNINRHKIFY